jgi:hypothetical protein
LRIEELNPLYFAGIFSSIAAVLYQIKMFKIDYYMNKARELDIKAIAENAVHKE